MTCSEFNEQLDACLANTLAPALRHAIDAHVQQCPACRDAVDLRRRLNAGITSLPRAITPGRDLWPGVAARLPSKEIALSPGAPSPSQVRWLVPLGVAAALALVAGLFWLRPAANPGWTVTALAGEPRVGQTSVSGSRPWRRGEWLETDATARAQFAVGTIGEVQLEPNSRLRLLGTESANHRIELARGTMHALIWAPPRLFFVETPAATAIDLGCAYTLHVEAGGLGRLEVTAGYVALENKNDHSAVVPAGMACRTYPGIGPGTPFASTASREFQNALDRFDSGTDRGTTLNTIVERAGREDVVTLWHLLDRVTAEQRGPLFDTLATFAAPPAGVTRAGIVDGDRGMLDRWGSALGLASQYGE